MASCKNRVRTLFGRQHLYHGTLPSLQSSISAFETTPVYSYHPGDSTHSILNLLPQELLVHIASYLPLSSVANLGLTNRSMLYAMGAVDPFTLLRKSSNAYERAEFLRNFEKHHPEEWICHACGDFHSRSVTRGSWLFGTNTETFKCTVHATMYSEGIKLRRSSHNWLTFHLVMRAYHYTPQHGTAYFLNHFDKEHVLHAPWSCSTLALPSNGHLLIRERWAHGLYEIKQNNISFKRFAHMCPHVKNNGMNRKLMLEFHRLKDLLRTLSQQDKALGLQGKKHQCPDCPTEVTMEIRPTSLFQGQITEKQTKFLWLMSVSCYKDLGDIKRPDAPEWRIHTDSRLHKNMKVPISTATWSKYRKAQIYDTSPPNITRFVLLSHQFEKLLSDPPLAARSVNTPTSIIEEAGSSRFKKLIGRGKLRIFN